MLLVLKRFFAFLKKPDEISFYKYSFTYKFSSVLALYFASIPAIILIISSFALFEDAFSKLGSHSIEALFKGKSKFYVFLLLSVLAPIIEELIFRLPLKYSRNYFLRFFVWIDKRLNINVLSTLLNSYRPYLFRFFFYFMAILFGIIHISNFENWKEYWYLAPIITLVQLILGLILGYIRVRFGLLWSIFYHSLHNFVFTLPFFIGSNS
jgi:hypothetical protein